MAKSDKQKKIAKSLLNRCGKTYAEDLGINLAKEMPGQLFQWLCASILYSARISEDIASQAARALKK